MLHIRCDSPNLLLIINARSMKSSQITQLIRGLQKHLVYFEFLCKWKIYLFLFCAIEPGNLSKGFINAKHQLIAIIQSVWIRRMWLDYIIPLLYNVIALLSVGIM